MAIVIIIAWGLIGFAAGAMIGTGVGPMFGFRDMEGSSAIFGVLFGGPVGAVVAFMLGRKLTRRFAGDARKLAQIAGGTAAAVVVAIAFGYAFDPARNAAINPGGSSPDMFFEVRLPAGMAAPSKSDVRAELRVEGDDHRPVASFYDNLWLGRDGDRVVIKGHVEMYRRSPKRVLALTIDKTQGHLFVLRLPAKPADSDDFGAWNAADLIEQGANGPTRKPAPNEALEIRYRVRIH